MEEDTAESVEDSTEWQEDEPPDWTDKTQEEGHVQTLWGVMPGADMATMILVEEVMIGDETGRCRPTCPTRSQAGQVQWMLCNNLDCFGCYCKANAVANLNTSTTTGETEKAIGGWSKRPHWVRDTTLMKMEHIAIFPATRPMQRKRLSALEALRLTRDEARSIVRKKTKAFLYFATLSTKILTMSTTSRCR